MIWLWGKIDNEYSEKTAYVYKTVAREIAEFYGQWSYATEHLGITAPERGPVQFVCESADE